MKKTIIALGLMLGTLTLTNCAKNEVDNILPEGKTNFSITAKAGNMTRTTLDATDYSIAWTASDQLNVFYCKTTTTATTQATFTASATNYANGNFDGTVTLEDGFNYDWFVMYPYNSYVQSCDGSKGTGFQLGNQTQTGNNSTAHIGAADIMVGKHTNTLSPSITLNHLGALHKFTVTNTESSDIIIKSISINGGTVTVGGRYPVNFTTDSPSLLTTTPGTAWTTTTLTVSGGTAIAFGESAAFYMILPPFTIAKDNDLVFTITDSNNNVCTLTKTPTAEGGLTFEAGKYYNANFNFAVDPEITVSTTAVELANTAASTTTFTVTSNTDWTATTAGSGYSISPSSGTASSDPVTVTVTATNAGGSTLAELGTISIQAGHLTKTVAVKQAGSVVAEQVTDVLTYESYTNKVETSYNLHTGITATSTAVYSIQAASGNSSIQLRSSNNNSGIVTTTSGGKACKITVVWNSSTTNGRSLDIYGKNTAYTAATDLYSGSGGTNAPGTSLGSIVKGTSTEFTITGDYEYIGLRSKSGAMYLDSISITYEK